MRVEQQLYNKYRPSRFEDVVGQDVLVKFMRNSILKKKYPHGWIIHGSHGSGKTTMARLYAKALFCESLGEDGNPCNSCSSCRGIDNGTNVNYIEEDSASNRKVESIEGVIKDCYDLPSGSDVKVVVLDECHMITPAAQSKLLKPLEEGLPHVIFLFLTTNLDKIIPALQSRMQVVPVSTVSPDEVSALLESACIKESFHYDKVALDLISKRSKGHIRDALTLLDQVSTLGDITEDEVRLYFLDAHIIKVCDIVLNLKDNLPLSLDLFNSLTTELSVLEIKKLLLEVINGSSKLRFINSTDSGLEESSKYRDIYTQFGDTLFNMFHFVNQEHCIDYFALENLIIILSLYCKDTVVYSAKQHVETGKPQLSNKVRQKSYRKSTNTIAKESVLTPNEFVRILKGELVS